MTREYATPLPVAYVRPDLYQSMTRYPVALLVAILAANPDCDHLERAEEYANDSFENACQTVRADWNDPAVTDWIVSDLRLPETDESRAVVREAIAAITAD